MEFYKIFEIIISCLISGFCYSGDRNLKTQKKEVIAVLHFLIGLFLILLGLYIFIWLLEKLILLLCGYSGFVVISEEVVLRESPNDFLSDKVFEERLKNFYFRLRQKINNSRFLVKFPDVVKEKMLWLVKLRQLTGRYLAEDWEKQNPAEPIKMILINLVIFESLLLSHAVKLKLEFRLEALNGKLIHPHRDSFYSIKENGEIVI